MIILLLGCRLHREQHFLGQKARVCTFWSSGCDVPYFRDRFGQLALVTNFHLQAHPLSIVELLFDLNVYLVESAHTMGKPHVQAKLCGSNIGQLDGCDLHWAQLLEEPLVVVPWTLILWIGEVSVLQLLEVRLDCRQWYDVRQVVVAQPVAAVKARHELAAIVPGREIREVLLDQAQRHLAFCLDESLLVLLIDFFGGLPLQLAPLRVLTEERLDHPQLVVPAMKVPLILLQHFVAQEQLILQDV